MKYYYEKVKISRVLTHLYGPLKGIKKQGSVYVQYIKGKSVAVLTAKEVLETDKRL